MALTRPRISQITTTVTSLNDPLTVLNGGATLANVDVGFVMNRANGLISNVALYWNETGDTFVTAFTNNTGITNSNITISSYASITAGNVLPGANVTYNLGSSTQRWKDLWLSGTTIYLGGATISAPTSTAVTITNPAGGSFSVTGTVAGQASGTFGNLVANSGIASTSTTTGALQVIGGAGISGNIYTAGNIVQTGTGYHTIPVGTTAQRPVSSLAGMIRYNSTLSSFEGYGVAWSSLGGVKSVDGQTYILAEATTAAGDDTLWFYNNSTLTANLTTTKFSLLQGTVSTSTTTGALVVAGGVGIGGTLYVGGNVTVTGHVLPSANVTYDLGSSTRRWRDLYLSGNTMVLGQANIQAHNSGITIYAPLQTVNLNQNLHTTSTPTFANLTISNVATINTATVSNVIVTSTFTANGNVGLPNQFLVSTGTGIKWQTAGSLATLSDVSLSSPTPQQVLTYTGSAWINSDPDVQVASAVFAPQATSDLGFVTDLFIATTEDLGNVADIPTSSYDMGVLRLDGIVSLNNLDQSVKSDYLGYAIIFGF